MVRELKDIARLDRISSPLEFAERLGEIIKDFGNEAQKFRKSQWASKLIEWIPLTLTTLLPVAATYKFGPIPGAATAGFTFGVRAITNLIKKPAQCSYPKVQQMFHAVNHATPDEAIKRLYK